jgi:predicted RNA-binding Zn-ribbon protein involved in translation (DUF1610 family)
MNQNMEKLEIELRTQKSEELKQILEQQTQKVQIAVNIAINSKKTVILNEFVAICPKCKHRTIIDAKNARKFKMGVCSACKRKTYLKFEGKLKRFGRNRQYSKIVWFTSSFEAFWLNCGAN